MKKERTVLGEIVGKAKTNERHYRKNDGTKKCVISSANINYFDEKEQKWKHTDNSIVENKDCYEANLGKFKARLSKNAENSTIEVLGKDIAVSWEYLGLDNPRERKTMPKIKVKKNKPGTLFTASETCYKNIDEGVDIQYVMEGNNVKENIIVRKKQQSYNFKFRYKVKGLELRKSENEEKLEFYSPSSDKVEFTIPAPYMYDANGAKSTDVSYEIESQMDGSYIVTVIASNEWIELKERKLPITIDPQLVTSSSELISCETYHYTKYCNTWFKQTQPSSQIMLQKTEEEKTVARIIINVKDLDIDTRDPIDYATVKIELEPNNGTLNDTKIMYSNYIDDMVHKISKTQTCNGSFVTIPITNCIEMAESQVIIELELASESDDIYFFYSLSPYLPVLEVEYFDLTQRASNKKTIPLVGGAKKYVDVFTGDSAITFAAVEDENIGISISSVIKESENDFCCGQDARLTIHEKLVKNTNSNLRSNYVYTDGFGDQHYFKETLYYIDNGAKKVIRDKSKIEICSDGELLYNDGTQIYEVKRTEATFSGLKATTKLEGFGKTDLFDGRISEQKQLEEQIDSYENALNGFVVVNNDCTLDCKMEEDLSNAEDIKYKIESDKTKLLLTEDEFNSLKSMVSQKSLLELNMNSIQHSIELSRTSLINNKQSLLNSKNSLLLQQKNQTIEKNENADAITQYEIINNQIDTILNQSAINLSHIKYLLKSIENGDSSSDLQAYNQNQLYNYLLVNKNGISHGNVKAVKQSDVWKAILTTNGTTMTLSIDNFKQVTFSSTEYWLSVSDIHNLQSLYLSLEKLDLTVTGTRLNENNEEASITVDNSVIIAKQIEDIDAQLEMIEQQIADLTEPIDVDTTQKGDLISQRIILEKQIEESDEQIEILKARSTDNVKMFLKYYKEYLMLNEEYKTLKMNLPVNYIVSDTGAKGFNEDGDLIVIYDKSNRYVTLEYEKYYVGVELKYRVARIVDEKENTIIFSYNDNNLLSEIIDSKGRITRYGYAYDTSTGKYIFDSITYFDGTFLRKSENSYGATVLSTEHEFSLIWYADSKLSLVSNFSTVNSISHNNIENSEYNNFISDCSISYGENSVEVLDNLGSGYEYKFNLDGQIIEEYEITKGIVTSAAKYSYNGENLISVIYPTTSCLNVKRDSFVFTEEYTKTLEYDDFDRLLSDDTRYIEVTAATHRAINNVYTYDENDHLIKKRTAITTWVGDKMNTDYVVEIYEYDKSNRLLCKKSYVEGKELTEGITVEEHIFDKNGYEIKTITYNSLEPSSKLYSEKELDENGEIVGTFEPSGMYKTTYVGNTAIKPNGVKLSNSFDYHSGNSSVTMSTEDGEENSTQTLYTNDLATKVISGDNTYEYSYDHKGRVTSICINGELHITYTYDDNVEETIDGTLQNVNKVTTTYANGDTVIVISDLFGNVLDIYEGHYNDDEFIAELHITNDFDNSQRVTEKIDSSINDCVSHNYNYDNKNRITSYIRSTTRGDSLPYEEEYSYNAHGNVNQRIVKINSTMRDISTYEYDEQTQKLKAFTCAGSTRIEPKVDCLGRNRGKTVSWLGTKIYSEDITYLKHGDHATSMPLTISYGNNTESGFVVKDRIKYKYDEMGNICEAYENGQFVTEYKYDALGRLVRENNKKLGKTFVFSYDNKGNILTRTEYAFTLKDDDFVKETTGTVFEYVYSGEKLVSYNGEAFEYDDIGNPTTYRGNTLTWRFGRRLTSFGSNTFDYNAEGKRIKKNDISYIYDSQGRLFSQSNGIDFFYDENSSPIAFAYNGEVYYYKKDLLGNVIEILDTTSTTVVKYVYDAWGNHTVTDYTDFGLGSVNPIRYRSYYFDIETGLYFLQTRYYDPQTGRFINIDDISYLDPETINGLNLYTYCGNNPIMRVDPNGNAFVSILIAMAIGFGIGAAVGGGIEVGKQIKSNGWNPSNWDWCQIGLSALGGGVAGAISALPIPGTGFLSYLGTFAIGGLASVAGGLISGSVDSWGSALMAFGVGGVANVLGRGVSDLVKHFKVSAQMKPISYRAQTIANMNAKNKSLSIWNMIGTDNFSRNAYKGWGYDQILNLLMKEATNQMKLASAENLIRYMVYSSLISSLASGWF